MRIFVCGLLAVSLGGVAAAQPVIREYGVLNGASYTPADHSSTGLASDSGIAPGSIFVIRGAGLGPDTLLEGSMPYPRRLPPGEGGTEVLVRSPETAVQIFAPLIYAWNWQVAAILPREFPVGPAEVLVTYQGQTSEPHATGVRSSAPGLFTISQNGFGPGIVQNVESAVSQPLNGLTRPARPGQYIILWGTGLGVEPSDVEVLIGDVGLRPDYAGPAPGYPGLDQINVRLPNDNSIPADCNTNVVLRSGGVFSRPVFIATADAPGPCSHPWGLSPGQMAQLDAGETLAAATFSVASPWFLANEDDRLFAEFRHLSSWEVAGRSQVTRFKDSREPDPSRSCRSSNGVILAVITRDSKPVAAPPLPPAPVIDAGDILKLTGPSGQSLPLRKSGGWNFTGLYEADTAGGLLPPAYFEVGQWFLTAPGGAGLPAFATTIVLPAPVRGASPEIVDRSQDLTVTWEPDGLATETMLVSVVSWLSDDGSEGIRKGFQGIECGAPAAEGVFTIPAAILEQLPASEDASVTLRLGSAADHTVRFTIPGIDYAVFTQSTSFTQSVLIR